MKFELEMKIESLKVQIMTPWGPNGAKNKQF